MNIVKPQTISNRLCGRYGSLNVGVASALGVKCVPKNSKIQKFESKYVIVSQITTIS